MSDWREQAQEQGMDEVDGDVGNVGMFQPNLKPGYEDGIGKQQSLASFQDSGLGSMASMPISMGPTETMIARMSLAEEFHAAQNALSIDEGYNTKSFPSETYTSSPIEEVKKAETSAESTIEESALAEVLYTQDQDGDTKLHVAISQLSPMVESIIHLAPTVDLLNLYNKMSLTPLHMAVITNQPYVVRQLLVSGARLEMRDAEGNTPLHIACREGFLEVVKALTLPLTGSELVSSHSFPLQQIPQDLDLKNYEGYTCMHLAGQGVRCDTICYLLSSLYADVNVVDGLSGRTALHHAVDVGDTNTANFLISICKANINARAYSGCTPLRLAIGRGHWRMADILRKAGAYEPSAESATESDYSTDDEMIDDCTIGGRPVTTISS